MRVPYQRFGSRVRVALAMVATLAAAGPADPDAVKDKDGRFAAAVHKGAAKDAANKAASLARFRGALRSRQRLLRRNARPGPAALVRLLPRNRRRCTDSLGI